MRAVLKNKKTGQTFTGRLIKSYPNGWSVLEQFGMVWYDSSLYDMTCLDDCCQDI